MVRFPVRPLSPEDSRALVASELRRRGRPGALPAAQMAALYEVVGGTPLAPKLVAAQMAHWPLPALLENLRRARHAPGRPSTLTYPRARPAPGPCPGAGRPDPPDRGRARVRAGSRRFPVARRPGR